MPATPLAAAAATASASGAVLDAVVSAAPELRAALAPLGVTAIAVFGSVARREEHAGSDVDLLVDVNPNIGLFTLFRMRRIAEQVLSRPVDVVPRGGLKPDVADRVLREAIPL